MSTMGAPVDRLQQLEAIEKEVTNSLQYAGQAINELSKDKPSLKQVEGHTSNFLKTLQDVENGLSKQITYLTQVSTGHPHECSSYAAQKILQMAWHRLEHARSRFSELERANMKYCQPGTGSQQQQQQPQQQSQPQQEAAPVQQAQPHFQPNQQQSQQFHPNQQAQQYPQNSQPQPFQPSNQPQYIPNQQQQQYQQNQLNAQYPHQQMSQDVQQPPHRPP